MFRGANISGFGTFQEINSTRGQLNLSIHEEQSNLIVFVSEARDLPVKPGMRSTQLNTYVKLYLMPDPGKKSKCKSELVKGTRNPNFRRSFTFQLSDADRDKRLYVSVWQQEMKRSQIGCMSFLVQEITLSESGEVAGWFFLMEPGYGDERNFPVDANPRHSSVSQVPKGVRKSSSAEFSRPGSAAERLHTRTVILKKLNRGGFGLTLSGHSPPMISDVSNKSPAAMEGLRKGDFILKVQETDTSKSTANHITTVLKACQQVKLVVQRAEGGEVSRSQAAAMYYSPPEKRTPFYNSSPQREKKEKKIPEKEGILLDTPRPEPQIRPMELDRQEAVRAVIRLQRETVEFCQRGHGAYYEPLKSAHLTLFEHEHIFLPVKEFKRLAEAIQSNIDIKGRDYLTNERSPVVYLDVVGAIFTYDLGPMVKFFKQYNETKDKSLEEIANKRKERGFKKFLEDSHKKSGMSIEDFFNFPATYKTDLLTRLRDVFTHTPHEHKDYTTLRGVIDSLDRLEQEQREEKELDKKSIENLRELRDRISFDYRVEKFDVCLNKERRYVAEIEVVMIGKKKETVILILLSDMILIGVHEPPYMCVKSNPIYLRDVMVHDVNCVDVRDFQLSIVDGETLQFRTTDQKEKERVKKLISERAQGTSTLRNRVQAKRSFAVSSSPRGGDIWEGDRKISNPDGRDGTALKFKSNLLPKEKDKYKKKFKKTEPPQESASPLDLQDLMTSHPVKDEQLEKWREGLDCLLGDPIGVLYLKNYMQREFSEENLCFYLECRDYLHLPEAQLIARAEHIYNRFIKAGALTQVNLDDLVLTELNKNMKIPKRNIFVRAQLNVFNLIKTDTYLRFVKSEILLHNICYAG